jgi:hypothetical protein
MFSGPKGSNCFNIRVSFGVISASLFQHQYLPEVAGPDGLFPYLFFKGFFEQE